MILKLILPLLQNIFDDIAQSSNEFPDTAKQSLDAFFQTVSYERLELVLETLFEVILFIIMKEDAEDETNMEICP